MAKDGPARALLGLEKGEDKMKKSIFLKIATIVIVALASILIANTSNFTAQDAKSAKFEQYRKAVKDAYPIDIKNFKDRLKGGIADGKAITNYDLKELLEGIKFEREHTGDSMLALEMAMDHLERIPDYYTHLTALERQCSSEKFLEM